MSDGDLLGFVHGDIDRAALKRTDAAWVEERLKCPTSRFVMFVGDRAVLHLNGQAHAEVAHDTGRAIFDALHPSDTILLGQDDRQRCLFGFEINEEQLAKFGTDQTKAVDLRSIANQNLVSPQKLGLLAQTRSLLHWHAKHPFCPVCGGTTKLADAGYRRVCQGCGANHFPRTDPVVIVIVVRQEKLLLGRSAHFIPNMYSTLAGFVEPGETLEDAARREILEESGIRLGQVIYHSNQPWPFPGNLMVGLIAEGLNDDITMDVEELTDCRWFTKREAEQMMLGAHPDGLTCPPPMAIAHHLIKAALET